MQKLCPKVLIGIPVSEQHGYATENLIKRIENLSYPNYDILIIDNSKTDKHFKSIKTKKAKVMWDFYSFKKVRDKLVACRNYMREIILENDYDYLLCIDQDVIPPFDLIEKLIFNHKDIVTGIYYNYFDKSNGGTIKLPVIWKFFTKEDLDYAKNNLDKIKEINPKAYKFLTDKKDDEFLLDYLQKPVSVKEATSGKLLEIKICGTGCILISKKILKEIEFRYEGEEAFDDTFFCKDATKKGYKIYADTNVQCEHIIMEGLWTWEQIKSRGEM